VPFCQCESQWSLQTEPSIISAFSNKARIRCCIVTFMHNSATTPERDHSYVYQYDNLFINVYRWAVADQELWGLGDKSPMGCRAESLAGLGVKLPKTGVWGRAPRSLCDRQCCLHFVDTATATSKRGGQPGLHASQFTTWLEGQYTANKLHACILTVQEPIRNLPCQQISGL